MTWAIEVWPEKEYAAAVAARITAALPSSGAVVITGGTTAAKVYRALDRLEGWKGLEPWDGLDVLFSDERCVDPTDEASNYRMAMELFLGRTTATVHRMPGELEPAEGARRYHDDIAGIVAAGPHAAFMGMGPDCHVGALYPGSPALVDPNYCAAVSRPDGLNGLTLTPTAMLACASIDLLVTGVAKAEAVERAVTGTERPETCPVRALAEHGGVTMCIDEPAARLLG